MGEEDIENIRRKEKIKIGWTNWTSGLFGPG